MENYQTYTTEDFVLDQEFRSWVKNPTQELDAFWQEWLCTNPEKQEIIEKAIYIITHLPTEAASSLSTAERMHLINLIEDGIDERSSIAFDKKEETIVVQLKIVPQTPLARKQVHSGNWTWRIAASVFIVFVLGLYFFKFNSHPEEKTITPVTLIEEQNPNGKKSVVLLKDGSRITLNADSKISYPQNFATNRRQVHLEGEAFFEVAKDASRPFEVITGDIKTVALGTSFNIRAYPEDRNISVALATGKVNIQYDKTRALLETLIPGQQIVYQRASGVVKKEQVPQEDISPWKTGVLRFDHAKQEEVFKQLERWYGVRFKIENENKLPVDVNGKFEDVSVENVMEVLRYSMKFKFTKEEDLITIHYEN